MRRAARGARLRVTARPRQGAGPTGKEQRTNEAVPRAAGKGTGLTSFVAATIGTGFPLGFYFWMARHPEPIEGAYLVFPPHGGLMGLPTSLGIGLTVGVLVATVFARRPAARSSGLRVVVAATGLYGAALTPVLGALALGLGAAAAVAWALWLSLKQKKIEGDGFLVFLHAGALGTAVCLFHQVLPYSRGWPAFLANINALVKLLS